jgi:hypothetical protein
MSAERIAAEIRELVEAVRSGKPIRPDGPDSNSLHYHAYAFGSLSVLAEQAAYLLENQDRRRKAA